MKSLDEFPLRLKGGSRSKKKEIPVEVLVDHENTYVVLNCECCMELLASRLPGGILIPIASTLKTFFEDIGMRNIAVRVTGPLMRRTYRGVIDGDKIPEMKKLLESAVEKFSKKRKSS